MKYFLSLFVVALLFTSCTKEEVCTPQIELGHTYAFGVADYTFVDYNTVEIVNANGALIVRTYQLTDGLLTVWGGGGQMRFGFDPTQCHWAMSNGQVLNY